jgi:hypothetical protein
MKTTGDSFLSMLLVNTSVDNFFEEYWQKYQGTQIDF